MEWNVEWNMEWNMDPLLHLQNVYFVSTPTLYTCPEINLYHAFTTTWSTLTPLSQGIQVLLVVVTFDMHIWMWYMYVCKCTQLRSQSVTLYMLCLLYTSPSPRDATLSRMPSSA